MYLGALLILLAAFAFASAGLYYVAAILVLFGKLLGALVVGIVGGCWMFAKGSRWVLYWLACGTAFVAGVAWRLAYRAAQEADAGTTRAHRIGTVTIEWLKRTYVKREKRGRGL